MRLASELVERKPVDYCAGRAVNEYYRNEDAFPLQFVKLREPLYLKALRGHDRQ
jgi:hypothetical protein